jgi:hypothetical protein
METSYEERMEHLIQIFKLRMEIEFKNKVNVARNKNVVIEEIIEEYNQGFLICFTFNNIHSDLISRFCSVYKRGISIDELVNKTNEKVNELISYGAILSKAELQMKNPYRVVNLLAKFVSYYEFIKFKRIEYPQIFQDFEQTFIDKINSVDGDNITEEELVNKKLLISQIKDFYNLTDNDFLLKKYDNLKKNFQNRNIGSEDINKLKIEWTGNKTDFYKLVYSLHKSNQINNGEGDITKIVEAVAEMFNLKLANSWQSSFSQHKNDNNNGYDHFEIFELLKKTYQSILEKK